MKVPSMPYRQGTVPCRGKSKAWLRLQCTTHLSLFIRYPWASVLKCTKCRMVPVTNTYAGSVGNHLRKQTEYGGLNYSSLAKEHFLNYQRTRRVYQSLTRCQ